MARQNLEQRVTLAAEAALAEQRYVSVVDVLVGLGWLAPSHLDQWRQGRVESLEGVVQANLSKVTAAMAAFRRWARDRGLNPSETDYVARTRDRRRLQFSVSGDAGIERAYRAHWVSPDLSKRTIEKQSKPPDLVVIWAVNDWTCTSCGGTGDLLFMEGPGRVERSAAGRALDPDAVRLAVAASVRHVETDYDELLMSGVDRESARHQVHERVEDVLSGWRATTR
jgi:Uncharacterized conserved protein (DUF2293)